MANATRDPDLIATLIPSDGHDYARNAFLLDHNPALRQRTSDRVESHIELRFSHTLKSPSKGITFGTNPEQCDVLLEGKEIDEHHFSLLFDENSQLILKDSSIAGTTVSFSGQAKERVQRDFSWVLSLGRNGGRWDAESPLKVEVHVPKGEMPAFKVEFPDHSSCVPRFEKKVDNFMRELNYSRAQANAILNIDSAQITSDARRPSLQSGLYIYRVIVGSGSYGDVYKVLDATTGIAYAHKTFRNCDNKSQQAWKEDLRKEMQISDSMRHDHIVRTHDYRFWPMPLLMIEYSNLGTLEYQFSQGKFTESECIAILSQCLQALQYLHSDGDGKRSFAHRDIKRTNILVAAREPRMLVKLADFGLAKDAAELTSYCGTALYRAPEVSPNRPHTTAVDIWSLGAVVLECAYKRLDAISFGERSTWHQTIIDKANEVLFSRLKNLLTNHMLKIDPDQRSSASKCLQAVYDSEPSGAEVVES